MGLGSSYLVDPPSEGDFRKRTARSRIATMDPGRPIFYDRWGVGSKIILTLFFAAVGVFLYFYFEDPLFALIPLPLVAIGWASNAKFVLLPAQRVYVIYRGLWPFAKPDAGPFSTLDRLEFYIDVRSGSQGRAQYRYYALRIHLSTRPDPIQICGGGRDDVLACAREFVAATGVRVVETEEAALEGRAKGSLIAELQSMLPATSAGI